MPNPKRPPKGPTIKAPPKTLVKPLPHGGKLPSPRKPKTRGLREVRVIIPDIDAAFDAILRRKPKA